MGHILLELVGQSTTFVTEPKDFAMVLEKRVILLKVIDECV